MPTSIFTRRQISLTRIALHRQHRMPELEAILHILDDLEVELQAEEREEWPDIIQRVDKYAGGGAAR